jgi:hypothetical protein
MSATPTSPRWKRRRLQFEEDDGSGRSRLALQSAEEGA